VAEQIYADGPIAAPAKYEVPGSSEIIPIAVQALLNGSGASGDFVPTLIFRSQAGHVIARVPTATTVAAGGSAEVSWFPSGIRGGATATAGGLDMCIATTTSPYTIPATGGAMTSAVTWNDVRPLSGAYSWPVSGDATKISMGQGLYLVKFCLTPTAAWVNTSFVVAQPSWVSSGTGFLHQAFFLTTNTSALFAGLSNRPVIGTEGINLQATDSMQLLTGSSNAAGTAMQIITMLVIRLGDSVAGTVI
jgi:hypothetical protein